MKVRQLDQPRGWAWTVGICLVKPPLLAVTRRHWIDGDNLPATGGCVVALNHVSHLDPFTAAHLLYDHGRLPRYLVKSGLFAHRPLAFFLRAAGQIPVERLTANATSAYDAAVAAVRAGECVVVYPEGTITRDPGLWPMTGKTGAARIGLETGCPVIPVGQWGAHKILAPYARKPHLVPPTTITMKVGVPVDLSDLTTTPVTARTTARATARIMDAITDLVADIRDESPPAERFDVRRRGVPEIGNPSRDTDGGPR